MSRVAVALIFLAFSLGAQEPQDPPPNQRPVRPDVQEDDPGRPVLKRGGPATKREPVAPPKSESSVKPAPTTAPAATSAPASSAPPPSAQPGTAPAGKSSVQEVTVDENGRTVASTGETPERIPFSGDALVERAREAAFQFNEGLPNFVCDQITSRFQSQTLKPDWRYKDRVEVELVYMGGKEDYRNVRINSKPVKKGSPEDSGTWSTGEFGTVLMDLMHPGTQAKFVARGGSSAAGMDAKLYDYTVEKANSHWSIRFGGEVKPAYKGSIWIDPKSARVLRIEMRTRQLPSDYQLDTVEATVDYGWIMISGKRFLLPVKSENLACRRGTFNCTKNEIEFRNYRKFEVESNVVTSDSEISFPEAEPEKKPADKKQDNKKTTPPSIKQFIQLDR